VASLINIPGVAFGIAATTIVGQNFGKRNIKEAKISLIYVTEISTICLTLLALLCIPFANSLAALYTTDTTIINLAGNLLKLNCSFMIFWSLAFVLPAGLKGAGDAKYTLVTTIVGMWLFRIILGYILCITLGLGVAGIWMGMIIDWCVRGILFSIRLHGNAWFNHNVIATK
jgi:Na+-driven multidrug efflux pump